MSQATAPLAGRRADARHYVEIENVDFSYPQSDVQALSGATLDIGRGDFACILGPSGCGKSTLLSILSGLYVPSDGRVTVGDKVLYESGRRVDPDVPQLGFVFQDARLLPWRTARQNIELVLKVAGIGAEERRERAERYMAMCGIGEFLDSWPANLSGGQRQRVAIARALALEPACVLMDEPFSTLDEVNARFLRQELLELWERTGQTIIFITHSIREAVYLGDYIHVMTAGPGRVLEKIDIDLARPRNYEDPKLTEVEARIVNSVLHHWGYYDGETRK